MTPERKSVRARALAVWIRERILQLGPTYIKLGQVGRPGRGLGVLPAFRGMGAWSPAACCVPRAQHGSLPCMSSLAAGA